MLGIITLLLYFLLGFTVALLALCFNHYLKPGMIFNWYASWLLRHQANLEFYQTNKNKSGFTRLYWSWYNYRNILGYLAKPLGLCPYCNGTWIAIIVYIYYFGISIELFLFIGIVWFFIKLLYNKLS